MIRNRAQILLARKIGKTRIIAETGAGQHGVATATVCAKFGMECIVYMGAEDVRRQALNVFRMKMLGAKVRRELYSPDTGLDGFMNHRLSLLPVALRHSRTLSVSGAIQ